MEPLRLVLASNNPHKAEELNALLDGLRVAGPDGAPRAVQIVPLGAVAPMPEPPEDQETFVGNALQKATFVAERAGLPAIADDSGLEVDALGGAPGVRSKRFSAEATTAANNALLLQRLDGVAARGARFVCAIAVVGPLGPGGAWVEGAVEGACPGQIGLAPRGAQGFGYDPLFWPDEAPGRSMAELAPAEKNQLSHRGRAVERLPGLLARLLGGAA
jgi:XTP/dITP diphosphohydrolase